MPDVSIKHILVAEDDQSISDVITIILEDEGYIVHKPNSYDEILSTLSIQKIDLVLLDVMLWGKSGVDICKKVKEDPKSKRIPIILLSARHDAKQIAASASANDVIEKPFDVELLLNKVKEHTQ